MSKEAMQQALEALQCSEPARGYACTCQGSKHWPNCRWQRHQDAITALRAALAEQAQPVADAARVIEWATSTPRKAAVHAFTEGPERQAAYWIEWAEARVVNRRLTTEQAQPVACGYESCDCRGYCKHTTPPAPSRQKL